MGNNKLKVALIQLVCPHYRIPFFKRFAEKVDLTLFYGKGEKKGSWQNAKNIDGFPHKKLFSISLKFHIGDFPVRLVWFPTLLFHIYKRKPEVIISEGFTNIANNVFTWVYCKIFSDPWMIWDSGRRRRRGKPMSLFRKLIEPLNIFLLKQAKAIIAYGSIAKDYFLSLGISPKKIFIAQNTIDVETCFKEAERVKANPSIIKEVRRKLNLNGKKVILYVGALEKRKKVENLITVFNELKKEIRNISLIIIGDGPYKETLFNLVQKRNIKDCLFLGKIIKGVGAYFVLSDIFVQPGWNSLATIEGMAYGKSVITVPYGGPEYEVVDNGKTGFIVERDNLIQLKKFIRKLITDEELRKQMGRLARARAKIFNLDNMVEGFLEAIKYTTLRC